MIELLFLFVPGAITFLVSQKLSGITVENNHTALAEVVAYSGLDLVILWLLRYAKDASVTMLTLNDSDHVSYTGMEFCKMMLLALATGVVLAFIKTVKIEVKVIKLRDSLFARIPAKVRKIASIVLVVVFLFSIMLSALYPQFKRNMEDARKNNCRSEATSLIEKVREEIDNRISEGVLPEELEEFECGGVTLRKVTTDQHWVSGTGSNKREAVYMVDRYGVLVYFSYRDRYYSITWSGPTDDEDYITSHGGWGNGKGYGWSK